VYLLFIFPGPDDPSINADNGIIKINAGLSKKVRFETQVDVDNCIDKSDGINKYVFLAGKPDAGNTRNHGNVFKQGCIPQVIKKLPDEFVHVCKPT
jgi:hypothetical protein